MHDILTMTWINEFVSQLIVIILIFTELDLYDFTSYHDEYFMSSHRRWRRREGSKLKARLKRHTVTEKQHTTVTVTVI